MRELIYLSERKLRQFHPAKPSRGWWRRVHEFGAVAPLSLGEVHLALSDHTASQRPDLAEVLRHLDQSDRSPKWFTDDEPQPGEWVRFRVRLNYKVVEARRGGPPALLFWDHQPDMTCTNQVRLLLHGSPEHLIGAGPPDTSHDETYRLTNSLPVNLVTFLNSHENSSYWGVHFSHILWGLLDELDGSLPQEISTWLGGYARVTANLEDVIVASPLYVEHVAAPESFWTRSHPAG